MLKFYNTLTRRLEPFVENEKGVVKMYSCGPTVYSFAHIGNMRAYLFMDAIRRVLKYNGYTLKGVLNITDVGHMTSDADEGEDKMSVASKREKKSPWEIAEFYTNFFMTQVEKLKIDLPEYVVKATDVIEQIIEIVQILLQKGYAYETNNGIYYDVEKYKMYGALSGMALEDKIAGARIEVDESKKHPADFALWIKAPADHIMQWPSPWGMGYPGWHIECSAIGIKHLGKKIDIHTGGIDHVTVHHENEIAQNYGYTGEQVVSNWMHVEFLQVDGGKMGKSLNNFYTIDFLEEKGFRALDFKYLSHNTHYSKKLNFTFDALQSANTSLTRLYEQLNAHKNGDNVLDELILKKYEADFKSAINNDVNMPSSLAVLWNMIKNEKKSPQIYELALRFDTVLGLGCEQGVRDVEEQINVDLIPDEVSNLAEKRWVAKQNKDWALADELRKTLLEMGYEVKDLKDGYEVKKR